MTTDQSGTHDEAEDGQLVVVPAMFWQPFRHDACGCYIDWGVQVPDTSTHSCTWGELSMREWINFIWDKPCPQHGGLTLPDGPAKVSRLPRYVESNNVWYRLLADNRKVYADRLADHLSP